MARIATDAFRRNWNAYCATLRRHNAARWDALKALAASGGTPPRDSKRPQREALKTVCTGCGRSDLPPGRAGRTCEDCRRCQTTASKPMSA